MNDSDGNGVLPEGWVATTIGEVAEVVGGGTPKTSVTGNFSDCAGHPWLTPADLAGYQEKRVSRGRRFLTDKGLDESAAKYMPAGTILFSSRAPIGYVAIASNPVTTNQGFRSFIPTEALDSDFAFHYLKWIVPLAEQLASGTTFNELSGSKAKTLPLPLPPVAEQRRIAARLDEVDECRASAAARLQVARAIVERFRSAVLGAACSGRITEDWRETNPGATPDAFLAGIAPTRTAPGNMTARDEQHVDAELEGHGMPAAWRVVTLGWLVERIEAGKSFQALPRPARDDEWGVVKVSAMSWGHFLQGENKAAPPGYEVNPAYEIHSGDLLLSRANTVELVGATVLVNETRPRLLLSDKSLRLVLHPGVDKRWLNYALGAPSTRRQFENEATGTSNSMRNLSQKKILATRIALPDIKEQREIVRRVDDMLTTADRLSAHIDRIAATLDRTSKASLSEAFRGELVPTEAALADEEGRVYESAEELLTRLPGRAQRAAPSSV